VIVSYTDFGKRIIEMGQPSLKDQGKVKVIGHGTDNGIFKPLSESHIRKDRKEIFGLKDSDFFVLNVSRNQWRKDIPRSMQLVKTFKDGKIFKKDSKLLYFINSKVEDMGGDLLDITFALECQDFVKFPDPKYFSEIVGVTPEFLNKLYNMADVLVSTTMGEGWGLPITEAMAAKTPVLAPYNSSIMEIIGVDEKRGYFIPSGTTTSEYFVYGSESSLLHPLANLEGGVKKLNKIYQDKFGLTYTGETLEKINNGYEYANFFNWEYIKQKWITLLEELDNE
jgi:glycosyltransferase involved in cell wall biosynthesis